MPFSVQTRIKGNTITCEISSADANIAEITSDGMDEILLLFRKQALEGIAQIIANFIEKQKESSTLNALQTQPNKKALH